MLLVHVDATQRPSVTSQNAGDSSHANPASTEQPGVDKPLESVSTSSCPSSASGAALQQKLRVDYKDLTFHELIGKGSFKTVYRGRWNNTNVAIICMRKGGMVTEARVLQRLSNHPNLVQFYRYIVTLYCILLWMLVI